ncbi:uncharacterized protein N7483_007501 [Penicillium malachiteum]|uniref:uncharacterized protein n=1 Tax=Penicillium malachiteum TaxID=1324776 RepID=UPI002548E685|nr:uncharacterized protein N7483_007501 [Penicillium malachiteum]KAJ5726144.1 hypothetical protein N7483_007501 [Penicillium malachiteum]
MDYDKLNDKDLRKRVNKKLGRNDYILVTAGDQRVAQEMGNARKLENFNEQESLNLFKQAFESNCQEKLR